MAGFDCLYWDSTCWVHHYLLEFGKVDWDLVAYILHSMDILDGSVLYIDRRYLTGPLSPIVDPTCLMPQVI
jgi:hypothetical protein